MANVRDRLFRVRIFTETLTTINFKERQRKERIWVGRRGKLQPASLKVVDSKVPGSNPVWKPFFFSLATNGWFATIGKLKQYGDFNKPYAKKKKKLSVAPVRLQMRKVSLSLWQPFCLQWSLPPAKYAGQRNYHKNVYDSVILLFPN